MSLQARVKRPCRILAREILLKIAYKLVVMSINMQSLTVFPFQRKYFSIFLPFCLSIQAEFGFNEHHQSEVINYMRFARSKRVLRLKTIDSCFEELKESR